MENISKWLPLSSPCTFNLHLWQSQARLYIHTLVSSLEQTWTSPPVWSGPRTDFQRNVFVAWPSLGSLRKKNRAVRAAALTYHPLEVSSEESNNNCLNNSTDIYQCYS